MISEDNARIVVTVSKRLKARLEEQCVKESRSLSNYINIVLQKHEKESLIDRKENK